MNNGTSCFPALTYRPRKNRIDVPYFIVGRDSLSYKSVCSKPISAKN